MHMAHALNAMLLLKQLALSSALKITSLFGSFMKLVILNRSCQLSFQCYTLMASFISTKAPNVLPICRFTTARPSRADWHPGNIELKKLINLLT